MPGQVESKPAQKLTRERMRIHRPPQREPGPANTLITGATGSESGFAISRFTETVAPAARGVFATLMKKRPTGLTLQVVPSALNSVTAPGMSRTSETGPGIGFAELFLREAVP